MQRFSMPCSPSCKYAMLPFLQVSHAALPASMPCPPSCKYAMLPFLQVCHAPLPASMPCSPSCKYAMLPFLQCLSSPCTSHPLHCASLAPSHPTMPGSDATGRVSGGNRRKALFRFHHPRSYERWPASTAPGPHDTLSHPTAAKVRCLAAPAVDFPVLQVAVSRALFTMAKDRCLAGRAPGASRKHAQGGPGSVSWNMVACLCTILGGPSKTLDECRLTDEAGQRVESIPDMYVYLRCTHVRGGRVISSQHMRRFVQTVAAALRSVTLISDAAAARLKTLMHAFDDAIVTSDAVGCSQVAAMGEEDDPLFLGFGGHRLVVSRRLACTPMNVGRWDTSEEPQPCVLSEWRMCSVSDKMDDESPGSFSYRG
ncbi:unnamed protein product [Closterium sp. NIES-64]|nr:unnamed protein product [Closterium sp. NIES-64]CAI5956981.1 unnamed protein product [Closterium sp. NIES-64]